MLLRFLMALMVSGAALAGCDLYSSSQGRGEPLIIAHRGHNSLSDPENAIESLEKLSPWVDGVEIDVRLSADGVPVLMHDSTVDRTTSGTGRVSSLTVAQLKALDAGGGATVPTLQEYLAAAEDRGLQVILLDMKDESELAVDATLQVLDRSPLRNITILMVRSAEAAKTVRSRSADIRLGRFGVRAESADEVFSDMLITNAELALTPPNRYDEHRLVVQKAHAVGLKAGSSTNNDRASVKRALADGSDIILTDIAGELRDLIEP